MWQHVRWTHCDRWCTQEQCGSMYTGHIVTDGVHENNVAACTLDTVAYLPWNHNSLATYLTYCTGELGVTCTLAINTVCGYEPH